MRLFFPDGFHFGFQLVGGKGALGKELKQAIRRRLTVSRMQHLALAADQPADIEFRETNGNIRHDVHTGLGAMRTEQAGDLLAALVMQGTAEGSSTEAFML